MAYAVISDIHSNMPALEAVFDDIESQGITDVYCLGDVIGYGPHPEPCADLIMERCKGVVCGNHDEALLLGGLGFNGRARKAIEWTTDQIKPGFFSGPVVRKRWQFLTELDMKIVRDRDLFIHGSPRDFTSEYVLPGDAHDHNKMGEIFEAIDHRLFLGHSHLPMVMTDEYEVLFPDDVHGEFECDPEQKVIINVGSVGQPRDRNPRACYVVVDDNVIRWRRVDYPFMTTVDSIKSIDRLDSFLGERLIAGM